MTTHNRLLAVLTAGVLTLGLTACGGDDEPARPTTTEAAENRGFTELQLGDTFTFTGDDEYPADVELRVDEISASKTCHNGIASYMDGTESPDSTYIQITGDMDVKSNAWNDSFYITDSEWVAVDADGYNLEIAPALLCNRDQTNTWSNPLDAGQKRHAVEEFEVKGTPVQMGVKPIRSDEGWGWTVPTATESTEPASGAPQPTAAGETPAVAANDGGFESGGIVNGPVVPDPDIPGANQSLPGEPGYTGTLTAEEFDNMSNAERSNHGFSAATPANCDGMQGAHEDSEALNC